jgi:hypothetical protein
LVSPMVVSIDNSSRILVVYMMRTSLAWCAETFYSLSIVQNGPAKIRVRSMTRIPDKGTVCSRFPAIGAQHSGWRDRFARKRHAAAALILAVPLLQFTKSDPGRVAAPAR